MKAIALSLLLALFSVCSHANLVVPERFSEQIYAGLSADSTEVITMPLAENQHGRSECVELLKALLNAPRTAFWREGRKLKANWNRVLPGTAIATFRKGRYPQGGRARGNRHAAIFLRASDSGIYVLDQYVGALAATERFIPWKNPRDKAASNNALAYSTVRW